MESFVTIFWALCVLCAALFLYTRSAIPAPTDPAFRSFLSTYLVVYCLAMAGDWMQGPYVYALYDHYGMSPHDIEVLFVAGFGSSMVFGTFVGSIADRYGRRTNCVLYGILYGMACVTKHYNNFTILMIGRFLGGIATSILYSAFESWLVYEHNKRGFNEDLLSVIFSRAVLGNSVVAIGAGVVAQKAADKFGYVAPFDVSLLVLVLMVVVIGFTWTENYGDVSAQPAQAFRTALSTVKQDHKVLCLGLIQSLFEGAMYTFVLEWTPALTPQEPSHSQSEADALGDETHKASIPHGYIFAAFMVAIMIGSSVFTILSKHSSVESFMRPVLFISALCLAVPVVYPTNQVLVFSAFLIFEVCVGIFWPALGTMRGKYVPEATRATIMNLFRVPLNLMVVIILVQDLPMGVIFQCCVCFLLVAAVCQQWLFSLAQGTVKTTTNGSKNNGNNKPTEKETSLAADSS